jgi:hypothetical protein
VSGNLRSSIGYGLSLAVAFAAGLVLVPLSVTVCSDLGYRLLVQGTPAVENFGREGIFALSLLLDFTLFGLFTLALMVPVSFLIRAPFRHGVLAVWLGMAAFVASRGSAETVRALLAMPVVYLLLLFSLAALRWGQQLRSRFDAIRNNSRKHRLTAD